MRIGDKDFWRFWTEARRSLNREKSRQILSDLMELAQMPDELSGSLPENQWLVARFAKNLPPHHRFWKELAAVVNRAFPRETLSRPGVLERKVHQFRYVISSQQAQYVRQHYKKAGMTDAQALAAYIRSKRLCDISVWQSARLHNKVAFIKGQKRYPDGLESVNFKVLLAHSHTEFILSSHGHFLNEVDAEVVTEAGIVNGASFNYGRKSRHWELDLLPIRLHDPAFRTRLAGPFHSPNSMRKVCGEEGVEQLAASYFNPSGHFGRGGQSLFQLVSKEAKEFQRLVGGPYFLLSWLGQPARRAYAYLAAIRKKVFPKNKKQKFIR